MIRKIREGRNNEVFLFKEKKQKFIIKKYKSYYETKYDRFFSEKIFLEYLNKKKIKNIPKIIYLNKKKKIIHFTYIKGKQIKRAKKKHLNICLNFLKKINYKTTYKNFKFQKASDACLSIQDHIKTCESRIKKLIIKYNHNSSINDKKILKFLRNQIIPEFKIIKSKINYSFTKSQIMKRLNKNELILSPSDFGFHNIILKNSELYFIDFEYAGWDDPSKLICDFFLNPDYLISKADKKYFLNKFIHIFRRKLLNVDNLRLILKFHFLKWVCVILNQLDIEISKKNANLAYFKKAVDYFNKNKKILE